MLLQPAQHVLPAQLQLSNLRFQADQRVGHGLHGLVPIAASGAKPQRGQPGSHAQRQNKSR